MTSNTSNQKNSSGPEKPQQTKADVLKATVLTLQRLATNNGVPLFSLLETYFDVEHDSPEFFDALAALCKLTHDIKKEIESIPLNDALRNRLLGNIGPYINLFGVAGLSTNAKTLKEGVLSSEKINDLDYVSIALNGLPKLQPTLEDQIENICAQLEDVVKDIQRADIQASVKSLLLKRIRELVFTLKHYEIFGQDLVIERVSNLFGSMVTTARSDPSGNTFQVLEQINEPIDSLWGVLRKGADWGQRTDWLISRSIDAWEAAKLLTGQN